MKLEDFDEDYDDEYWAGYNEWSAIECEEWEKLKKEQKERECICPVCGTVWEDKYEVYACPCEDRFKGE
jgi:rubrerythrin